MKESLAESQDVVATFSAQTRDEYHNWKWNEHKLHTPEQIANHQKWDALAYYTLRKQYEAIQTESASQASS